MHYPSKREEWEHNKEIMNYFRAENHEGKLQILKPHVDYLSSFAVAK